MEQIDLAALEAAIRAGYQKASEIAAQQPGYEKDFVEIQSRFDEPTIQFVLEIARCRNENLDAQKVYDAAEMKLASILGHMIGATTDISPKNFNHAIAEALQGFAQKLLNYLAFEEGVGGDGKTVSVAANMVMKEGT